MNIQENLIAGDITLSQALYLLRSQYSDQLDGDFLEWMNQECNGYSDLTKLPEYRFLDCVVYAKYYDGLGNLHDEEIDVSMIDDYLKKNGAENALVSKMRLSQNVESLEQSILGNKGGYLSMPFPNGMNSMLAKWFHHPAGCNNLSFYQQCHVEQGANVLMVVKSRLMEKLGNINMSETTLEKNDGDKKPLVFISHASKDKAILKLFVDNILKKGLNLKDKNIVFTSYEATGVVPGDNIPEYIKRNIGAANLVLAMISKNYKKSEVCMNEVGAAWALGKTPLQIMLPNTNSNSLGWLIHLDKAVRIDDRDSLDSLEEVMCDALGITAPTAKHWNPCTKDFLEALKSVTDCYDDAKPECLVVFKDGKDEVDYHPKYQRTYYYEKQEQIQTESSKDKVINAAVFGGINQELIASIQKSMAIVQPTSVKVVRKTTNESYVRVQLYLINNSNQPIENGNIIIQSDNEDVVFAKTNVKEHSIALSAIAPRLSQSIYKNGVEESFRKPINPTAQEMLYDFYITAPADVTEFKLLWKLESLKTPLFGEINVRWKAEYEDNYISVPKEDPKVGTTEVTEYKAEE